MIPRARALAALALAVAACAASPPGDQPPPGSLRVPELGPIPPLPIAADDPPTAQKLQLGTDMFFDARLSGSGHTTCNACHGYNTAFQDNLLFAVPDRSYPLDRPTLDRNTLSFFNVVYAPVFRWDGSHTDLTQVMAFPFSEPNMNLGSDVPSAQVTLKQRLTVDVPGYLPLFQAAYGVDLRALDPPTVWRYAGKALTAFARGAVSRDAPFDRWNAGDDGAMSADAVSGVEVFRTTGRCVLCHNGPFFTDFGFHNVATSPPRSDGTRRDEGRYRVTGRAADRGAFLTPTLRGAYDTGPYFHDGSAPGLRAVFIHLATHATDDPNHDSVLDPPIVLSSADLDHLVAFMKALRGAPVDGNITPPLPGTP